MLFGKRLPGKLGSSKDIESYITTWDKVTKDAEYQKAGEEYIKTDKKLSEEPIDKEKKSVSVQLKFDF